MDTEPLRFCRGCKKLAHIWNLEPVFHAFETDGTCECCKKKTLSEDSIGMVVNAWRRRRVVSG